MSIEVGVALPGAALCVLIFGSVGCSDWRARVAPGMAVRDPEQTAVEVAPFNLSRHGASARLIPRARYATKAWVVAVDDDFDDGAEALMSRDVALAWGPLGHRDIMRTMSFHLARRYVSVRWGEEMPLPNEAVMRHLSNHHLIAGTEELERYLEHVRPGDLLALQGLLVDVEGLGPYKRTSLRRDDVGNGACEILYVERAEITRPPKQ